jgi:hypothetical protein
LLGSVGQINVEQNEDMVTEDFADKLYDSLTHLKNLPDKSIRVYPSQVYHELGFN